MSTEAKHGGAIKNIAVGVITSVVAAVIIYFVTKPPSEFKQRKEATSKAWESFKENRRAFVDASKAFDSGMSDEIAKKAFFHQIDIAITNMDNIKKETKIDYKMASIIDIVATQIKEMKPLFENYIKNRETFIEKKPDALIDDSYLIKLQNDFNAEMSFLNTRDTLRINRLREGLYNEYGIQ